jgi:hypothetical protein
MLEGPPGACACKRRPHFQNHRNSRVYRRLLCLSVNNHLISTRPRGGQHLASSGSQRRRWEIVRVAAVITVEVMRTQLARCQESSELGTPEMQLADG